jgi:hypothetical protein
MNAAVLMDLWFLLLGLVLWGLMALLAEGLARLAPKQEGRP